KKRLQIRINKKKIFEKIEEMKEIEKIKETENEEENETENEEEKVSTEIDETGWFLKSPSRLYDVFYRKKREAIYRYSGGKQLDFEKYTDELINCSVDISSEVGKVLEEIVGSIGKTTDLVGEIAAASQEQAQGIEQVNSSVTQMDKVTQQNAANAEESASASEELSAQAEELNNMVRQLQAVVGGSGATNGQATAAHAGTPGNFQVDHSTSSSVHRTLQRQRTTQPKSTQSSEKESPNRLGAAEILPLEEPQEEELAKF
ncbi:hypothetical protein LCGC14_1967830, partial [marine sediment metagenome]